MSPACSSDDAWEPSPTSGMPRVVKTAGLDGRRQRRRRLQGLHGYLARTVVTVATSAAMLEVLPEGPPAGAPGIMSFGGWLPWDLITGIPALLRSAIRSAGAHTKEAIDSLAAAIGEPPRRPFEDPFVAPGLSWAADIAIVCSVLALLCFVCAFASQLYACEGDKDVASDLDQPEAETRHEPLATGRFSRVMVVVVLPAISGAVLNMRQSVIPAMLCSF